MSKLENLMIERDQLECYVAKVQNADTPFNLRFLKTLESEIQYELEFGED